VDVKKLHLNQFVCLYCATGVPIPGGYHVYPCPATRPPLCPAQAAAGQLTACKPHALAARSSRSNNHVAHVVFKSLNGVFGWRTYSKPLPVLVMRTYKYKLIYTACICHTVSCVFLLQRVTSCFFLSGANPGGPAPLFFGKVNFIFYIVYNVCKIFLKLNFDFIVAEIREGFGSVGVYACVCVCVIP